MKTKIYYSIILITLIFSSNKINAQAPNWQWVKQMGGIQNDYCNTIAVDGSGNIYTAGSFWGTADFDPGAGIFNLTPNGQDDIFVTKLDSLGNFIWAKSIGGINNDGAGLIALDESGNIYITGYFSGAVDFDPGTGVFNLNYSPFSQSFITKLDSGGNLIWAKATVGPQGNGITSLFIDSSDNIYASGVYKGTVDFNPDTLISYNLTSLGDFDIFMTKLDSAGNFIWVKSIGGAGLDYGRSMAFDASGNIYMSGRFTATVDFNPDSQSTYNLTPIGSFDIFVCKFDNSGNFIWAKQIGGTGNTGSLVSTVDANGNSYVTGTFSGLLDFDPDTSIVYNITSTLNGPDLYMLKLDSSGSFISAKTISSQNGSIGAMSITPDVLGNIYTTGAFFHTVDFDPGIGVFNLTSAGNEDFFISKSDNSGNFIWAKALAGTAFEYFCNHTFDKAGNVLMCGGFKSPFISFDTITLANNDPAGSNSDVFIAKLNNITSGLETILSSNNVSIYPNPTTNQLHLTLSKPLPPNTTITITDMQGRVVKEVSKITPGGDAIDVSTLSQGVYLLKVNGQMQRFVKM